MYVTVVLHCTIVLGVVGRSKNYELKIHWEDEIYTHETARKTRVSKLILLLAMPPYNLSKILLLIYENLKCLNVRLEIP